VNQPRVDLPEDRAAMRAFLQRCEVRLSTMHRVATALLSGAGILVLLPALERDSIILVLRSLLTGPLSWSRGLLVGGVLLSILLALTALWLMVMELTRFYFHSNHVQHVDGESFTPRFTLTGLRLPLDELSPESNAIYESVHVSTDNVRLLVPGNDRARARIDRQLNAYPGLVDRQVGDPDTARADALFELAASRRRSLIEEVSKVEHGMVRHMVRLQTVILRYVKALMVVVVTAVASLAGAAAVTDQNNLTAADQRWIAGAVVVWAPVVIGVVGAPVRWLESLLRAEGAERMALRNDAELTQVEDVTRRIASVVWLLAVGASIDLLVHHDVSRQGRLAEIVALCGSLIAMLCALGVIHPMRVARSRDAPIHR
jgi:hypothetical protein